jgi:hypothetical protein
VTHLSPRFTVFLQNTAFAQSVKKVPSCPRPVTTTTTIFDFVHRFQLFSNRNVSETGFISVNTRKVGRWFLFNWALWRELDCRRPLTETGSLWRNKRNMKIIFFRSAPLVPLYGCRGSSFILLIISQTVGLLGRVTGPSQGRYLNTGQHKHRNTHIHTKHPCLEWDSNPRSRLPRERRQCMPYTARLPCPAMKIILIIILFIKIIQLCVRFWVFTAVTMKNAVFWMWHRVDLVWTDVSEERIASIFRVAEKVIKRSEEGVELAEKQGHI